MSYKNNPEVWDKLLNDAPYGSALMGGAVRDFYCGKEAKDFDIFHSYKFGVPMIDGWTYVPREFNAEGQPIGHAEDYDIPTPDGENNPIGSVYDYDVPLGLLTTVRVQLIGVHYANPMDNLANFDHTLTLGVYNKSGLFLYHDLIESVQKKQVKLLNKQRPEKSLLRAIKAVNRIAPNEEDEWTYLNF